MSVTTNSKFRIRQFAKRLALKGLVDIPSDIAEMASQVSALTDRQAVLNGAKVIADKLRPLNPIIDENSVLEALSLAAGFRDWNTWSASLPKTTNTQPPLPRSRGRKLDGVTGRPGDPVFLGEIRLSDLDAWIVQESRKQWLVDACIARTMAELVDSSMDWGSAVTKANVGGTAGLAAAEAYEMACTELGVSLGLLTTRDEDDAIIGHLAGYFRDTWGYPDDRPTPPYPSTRGSAVSVTGM